MHPNGQAALCWVAGADPTGGMEYVTEKAIAENDPSKQKDLAKALLQERANIKDFICQVHSCEYQPRRVIRALRLFWCGVSRYVVVLFVATASIGQVFPEPPFFFLLSYKPLQLPVEAHIVIPVDPHAR